MDMKARGERLRGLMKEKQIDAYIIPTADFHQSEYVGEHFKARKFMTGFSGSAGTALFTKDRAFLWTDGRYFIQAAAQLKGSGVELMKMGEPGVPTLTEYLRSELAPGSVLGFDGRVAAMAEGKEYEEIAKEKGGRVVYEHDLVNQIWEDRPSLSREPTFALELRYAGEDTASKLARIRAVMKENHADSHILTTLDDICWILNIRGNDVEFFPLVLSYAVITMEGMDLYIDESKLDDRIRRDLEKENIRLCPYNDIYEDVKKLAPGSTVLIDPGKLNYAIYSNIPDSVHKVERANPEILFKAVKNETEIENMRKAQIKDSVAHIRFMKWLKENIGKMKITELSASEKLDDLRKEMGNFIRPSFEPIVSFGEHGAIVHYTSSEETDVELKEGSLFLTDTGAGFYEGTTDITRTYALGEIPQIMKEHFTLVAMSNLRLADVKFKKGCNGTNLDYVSRSALWERGLDYNHGTGHGVGYLLNIHEGPAGIRWQLRADAFPFEPGMIITDEPGIYIEGSHGVRLENELLIYLYKDTEYGQFLAFEPITYIPMDLDAICPEIMKDEDRRLLNDYHRLVYEKMAEHLNEEEREWLRKYTREI